VSEWSHGFTLSQNMDLASLLCCTPPTEGTVDQHHNVQISSQHVMSSKEASNNTSFCSIKGQEPGLRSWTRARNQFSSLSLCTDCHIAICRLSTQHFTFFLIFCLEIPKASSGPKNWWTVPSLASLSAISFPHTLEWPEQSHRMLGENVVQSLLTLLYQQGHYFGSLKGFQGHLTDR
jgi:hypothetical protein